MKATTQQKRIFADVLKEREWQGSIYSDENDNKLPHQEWVTKVNTEIGEATKENYKKEHYKFRRQLVRVAALAVAGLEAYDRTNPKSL